MNKIMSSMTRNAGLHQSSL